LARFLLCEQVDVVHLHGLDFEAYLPARRMPLLATLHLPIELYSQKLLEARHPTLYFSCVSRAQRRSCPQGARIVTMVTNGVHLGQFEARLDKGPCALSLGRICPEKGYHLAMDAARSAGVPFLLAGCVFLYEAHRRYF